MIRVYVIVVNLGLTEVKDADLEPLDGLATVKKLTLNDTPITDAALVHLKDLAGLEKLYLVDTKVTDAGLERLKGLKNLQILSLAGTQVTDAGLEHLKAMTGLKEIFLYGTNTKLELEAYLKAIFEAFGGLLGSVHQESYAYVDEVSAAAYGYGGKSQEFRFINGRLKAA